MLAKQRYSIYFLVSLHNLRSQAGHKLLASDLCKPENGSAASYATVARRVWQSVAVRAFVLAALVKAGIVKSPYEWLLLSMSGSLGSLINTACQVFEPIERIDFGMVLRCCSKVIGYAPIVIVGEAPVLGLAKQWFEFNSLSGTAHTIDLWICVSNALCHLSVGGMLELGTQMCPELIRAGTSCVKKSISREEGALYAIGCFPVE
jgi:hypothetical protein